MPHAPSAPPGTRFFARVDRFHCECPSCGTLCVASKDADVRHLVAGRRRRTTMYNPISSTLYCPGCRKAWGVGLLLWPLARGGGKRTIPADHQPTRRQLRELAQYSYGIWTSEITRQGAELNIAIDQECTCPRSEGGWKPSCPVHGWTQVLRNHPELGDSGEG